MTYTVSSGMLNSTIPYHTILSLQYTVSYHIAAMTKFPHLHCITVSLYCLLSIITKNVCITVMSSVVTPVLLSSNLLHHCLLRKWSCLQCPASIKASSSSLSFLAYSTCIRPIKTVLLYCVVVDELLLCYVTFCPCISQ